MQIYLKRRELELIEYCLRPAVSLEEEFMWNDYIKAVKRYGGDEEKKEELFKAQREYEKETELRSLLNKIRKSMEKKKL